MHRVAGDREAGAGDVFLAQIRQRLLEFAPPLGIAARDLLRTRAGLPDAEEPDPVEAQLGQAIQFGVRNVVQRGWPAQRSGQFRQPDAGVDLIERGIAWLTPCQRFPCSLLESRHLAALQGPLGIQVAEELDEFGHEPGPAGLVARAQPCAVVAVEVFVEEDVVAPVGIGLELLRAAVHGTPAVLVAQEDPGEPIGDLLGHLEEIHHPA